MYHHLWILERSMVLTQLFYLQSAALKTSDHWKVQWCLHNCFICSLQHWRRQTIGELLLWELAWRNSKSIWTCLFSPPPPLGPFHRHLSFAGFAVRSRARSKSKFAKWFCSLDLLDLSLIAMQILALHLNLFLKYVHLISFGQSSLKSAAFSYFSRISQEEYEKAIKAEIDSVVKLQEELDIDVLVHGEPEVDFYT